MKIILLVFIGFSSLMSADFTRYDSGVVRDNRTGLIWQDDTVGNSMTWQNGLEQCEALILGGKDDWRLPNLNELTFLVDDAKYSPSINDVFEHSISEYYWSSTTRAISSNYAWGIYFNSGNQFSLNKDNNSYVRCVRGE